VVIVSARGGWQHKGITMRVTGSVKLTASQRAVGLFESTVQSQIKPKEILKLEGIEVIPPGRVPDGHSEYPFEFVLRPTVKGEALRESYHGVYVNVTYTIAVECKRGAFKAPLERELEFIVEVPTATPPPSDPKHFAITPESLENVRSASLSSIPRFKVTGKLHRQSCPITLPFTGELVVEQADAAVTSVEIQLVRAETVRVAHDAGGGFATNAREATEIQGIQIADGDICRNLVVPLYMIFPRLFTCPTQIDPDFKVEFEINLVVVFGDGYMVTENFPIKLHRCEPSSQTRGAPPR